MYRITATVNAKRSPRNRNNSLHPNDAIRLADCANLAEILGKRKAGPIVPRSPGISSARNQRGRANHLGQVGSFQTEDLSLVDGRNGRNRKEIREEAGGGCVPLPSQGEERWIENRGAAGGKIASTFQ